MPDPRSDAFQRALDEVRRQDCDLADEDPRFAGKPRLSASVEFGPARSSGGEARFDLALDWTDEPAERLGSLAPSPKAEAAPRPGDSAAEIAEELGFGAAATPAQLASRWRNFLWRNHPDRQPVGARERANNRVAIANMLYDRARRELAGRR